MAAPQRDERDPGGVRITPRMWLLGGLWLAVAFVLAVLAADKAFRFSDEVGSYQQERSSEAEQGSPVRYKSDRD